MNKFLFGFIFFTTINALQSQSYFQQEVDYKINVSLDDVHHELNGNIEIIYKNNSAESLDFIYMHLWPNAYKNRNTALSNQLLREGDLKFYFADSTKRGYMDQLNFTIDGGKAEWELVKDNIDIAKITLSKPLAAGGTIIIKTPFHVKIPSAEVSRLGHLDQAYMITQWYPKPAVFDKNGWNAMNYLNQGEYYSEFGSFDVSITLPENYVVAATGDLQNPEEIEWLETKSKEDTTTLYKNKSMDFPASSSKLKTIRYLQKNVHDFAWFADKRFHVLKGEVELPLSKRKVNTWAMFTNAESKLWKNSIQYLNDATYYYSLWNGEYPYNNVTAVDGTISAGGGMEYPNITVIGSSGNAFGLETVIMHEVGHNWFYGILGSNERDHAWMDEGINSINEMRYVYTKYPDAEVGQGILPSFVSSILSASEKIKYKEQYYYAYLFSASKNTDQPLSLTSNDFTPYNYGGIVYSKTAIIFQYLKSYLGDEKYDQCMHAYFDQWKFKHPQPEDLKKCFEDITKEDLSWIFDGLINTKQKIDFKISTLKKKSKEDGIDEVIVKSKYNFKGPVFIGQMQKDSLLDFKIANISSRNNSIQFKRNPLTTNYRIDPLKDIPELNRNNNTIRANGVLRKIEPIHLRVFGKLESGKTSNLYFLPLVGWNNYDKWFPGISLYNAIGVRKPFEFRVSPMYSFEKNRVVGFGNFSYLFAPRINESKMNIKFEVEMSRFSLTNDDYLDEHYNRIEPSLNFDFINLTRKNCKHDFKLGMVYLNNSVTEQLKVTLEGNNERNFSSSRSMLYLQYNYKNSNVLFPQDGSILTELYDDFSALSADYNIGFVYNKKKKKLGLRFFAGTTMGNSSISYWQLGGQNGRTDPRYDDLYLGRLETKGLMSRQFKDNHAAFKTPTAFSSGQWMLGINLKAEAPLFFGVFADFAIIPSKTITSSGSENITTTFVDAGIYLPIIKNEFEIYFPITYSSEIKNTLDYNNVSFGETIRFVLNLDFFNPFKAAEKF